MSQFAAFVQYPFALPSHARVAAIKGTIGSAKMAAAHNNPRGRFPMFNFQVLIISVRKKEKPEKGYSAGKECFERSAFLRGCAYRSSPN
jgi:hypothetical protein